MQVNQLHESAPAIAVDTGDSGLEELQECFRSELSAMETYQLALQSISHVGVHHVLQDLLTSHARRTDLLREKIWRLGGEKPTSSGVWGAFAKAIQVGADLLGDRIAVAALEDGEDRLLELYTEGLPDCDPTARRIIDADLLPEQRRSHELCRMLQSYVRTPS